MKNMFLAAIASSIIMTASSSFAGGSDTLLGGTSSLLAGSELKTLGLLIAISVPVGLLVGMILRKWRPNGCQAYAKFCRQKTWLFLVGALYFGGQSIRFYADDHPYFGTFFGVAAALQALAWVSTLCFKRPQNQ